MIEILPFGNKIKDDYLNKSNYKKTVSLKEIDFLTMIWIKSTFIS